jgi:hypothetical protein
VNKLDLLFDSKQFEVAFGEAIGESGSVFRVVSLSSSVQRRHRPPQHDFAYSNLLHAPPIEG